MKRKQKFGIRIPNTTNEALETDRKIWDVLWKYSIIKYISVVRKAFKVLQENDNLPPRYQKLPGNIIFDLRMENFTRKSRYLAGQQKTGVPTAMTSASMVYRESVRIALSLATLNDLDVMESDIKGHTYQPFELRQFDAS